MAAITSQQLANASLDAASIEGVVNGPISPGLVGTRLGGSLKTLSRVLDELRSINYLGDWATTTVYAVKDSVKEGGVVYLCVTAHTSGTFATDLAAGKWVVYQSFASSLISYDLGLTGYVSRTVESAIKDTVSVKDFGAAGDDSNNDTGAIQAAIDSGASTVFIPNGIYRIDAEGLVWPANVKITGNGTLKRVAATPTAGILVAESAGVFKIDGITFDDGGHSQQHAMIEVNHPNAKCFIDNIRAGNGYSGVWIKQAELGHIRGSEFFNTSHNIYLGYHYDDGGLPGVLTNIVISDVISHDARTGGDGLKTASTIKKLLISNSKFYNNPQDGIDLFAGCDEAMIIGCDCSNNGINGIDIKIGVEIDYPVAAFGYRRQVALIGCIFNENGAGVKIYGDETEGYFQDCLVQGCNINKNSNFAISVRGLGVRIIGNLMLGNGTSTAASYAVINVLGHSSLRCKGGIITGNVIGNNGAATKTNTGINLNECSQYVIANNLIGNDTERTEAAELDVGITVIACDNIMIHNNIFQTLSSFKMNLAAGSCILGQNSGIVLRNAGTAVIAASATTVAVTHGCAGRPDANQVRFFPAGPQQGVGVPFTGATSTTTINPTLGAAPASPYSVYWEVDLTNRVNTYAILA